MSGLLIGPEPPDSALARSLLERYYRELDQRFRGGFELELTVAAAPEELTPPHGLFLLASLDGRAVGCGGVRMLTGATAEIKRMWVDPEVRGRGVGRDLLAALENGGAELGAASVRLDTAGGLTEARALYESSGYREIAAYNDNPYADHWFEKRLPRPDPKSRPGLAPAPAPGRRGVRQ